MDNLLDKLNDSQKQAVTHKDGPLLIVAGAGTGKTTVLTRRYAWLLQTEKLSTENILAVTFTEKASQEMEDRILQMLPNGTYDFWIHTFHGFCQRVLEEHALEIGLPNRFKLLSESDAWILLNRRFEELPLDHYRPLGNPVKFLQAILRHISRVKDEGINPDQYVDFAENVKLDKDTEIATGERKRLKELADVYAAYQNILHDEGALDFGDLIVETLRLFKERPAVLNKYREQFKYLLIDEFQDTNWAQYELIKLLASPKNNITVVGDDDQAIYKFRGASLANILQFKDDYKNTKTLTLTDNYRSQQEVLDVAYTLIENNNPYRLEVSLESENLNKKLKAHKGLGAEVFVQWSQNIEKEAEWVATDINANHGPNHTWSEFAILVRSNDEALPFVQTLERKGIPYKFFALRGLYTKPIIVDLIALLAIANKPNDNVSLWRVLSMDCLAIPLKALAEINKYADRKGYTLWDTLQNAQIFIKENEILGKLKQLVATIEKLNETARRESPIGVLHSAVEETGYLNHIINQSESEKIEAISLLNEFVSRVRRYESSVHAPNHRQFMEELQMEIDSGEQGALHADAEAGPDVVRIMTIHASKGLEFETVYLVSMVDQRFPTRRRSDAIPLPDGLVKERLQEGDVHLQEERRLCYVAMTRAKSRLILTGALDYGGARQKKPSCFIDEARLECNYQETKDKADISSLQKQKVEEVDMPAWREMFALKRRFSFTQLVAYKKCPLQYKFAHIYRVPVMGSHQKSFGQSMHLALQYILKQHLDRTSVKQGSLFDKNQNNVGMPGNVLQISLDEAIEIFKQTWIDEWYPDRSLHDKYFKEGLESIRAYYKRWNENLPNIYALEEAFDWRLGDHSIKGKIDRIDRNEDGGWEVLDYKTSEYKEGKAPDALDKEQLQMYQLALEARGRKVSRLAYSFVRAGGAELEIPLLKDEDKVKFEELLKNRMDEILISEFPATPSSFLCKFCDFKNICEFRK